MATDGGAAGPIWLEVQHESQGLPSISRRATKSFWVYIGHFIIRVLRLRLRVRGLLVTRLCGLRKSP